MAHYTVSTKKLYPCIRCHNSGKQRRILTKFYPNIETLNCKQVTKFQQNWSTSATATASLVRSLKSISVHHRHRRDWPSSVRPCEWQDVSTPKVCVQIKMSTVCSNASSKTWSPLPDRFIDDHLMEMFPLFDQARLQLVDATNLAVVHTLLQLPTNLVVDAVKVRTVSWPQSWSDYVTCLRSLRQHNVTSKRLSASLQYVTLYWKLKYFVVNIWILIIRVINNIFLWNLAILSQIYS